VLRGVVSQRLLPKIGGGRVAAVEVMIANSRIQELIREDKAEYIPEAVGEGSFFKMQTLNTALIAHVVAGLVDQDVAANAAPNRHDFMIALDRALKEHAIEQAEAADAHERDALATGAGAA
jgi:twitching motility protein PilT